MAMVSLKVRCARYVVMNGGGTPPAIAPISLVKKGTWFICADAEGSWKQFERQSDKRERGVGMLRSVKKRESALPGRKSCMELLECGHLFGPVANALKRRECEACEVVLDKQELRWCYACEKALPFDMFRYSPYGRHNLRPNCKECQAKVSSRWYKENKKKTDARAKLRRQERAKRTAAEKPR